MTVRELLDKLTAAKPEAEVQISVVVERDAEGEWSKNALLSSVWVFDEVVCLDQRKALSEEAD